MRQALVRHLFCLLAAGTLTACGSGSNDSPTPAPPLSPPAAPPVAPPASAPAAPPAASQPSSPPVPPAPAPLGQWQGITPEQQVARPWSGGSFTSGPAPFFGWWSISGAIPAAPLTLYATLDYSDKALAGVWKSTDGGDHWALLSQGPGDALSLGGFVVADPVDPDIVYAGVPKSDKGILKSINGGQSWQAILPADVEHDVYKLAIDPHDHRHLLVSFHSCQRNWPQVSGGVDGASCGLLESRDGGAHWAARAPGGWSGGSQLPFFVGQRNDGTPDTQGSHWIVSNQNGAGVWRTEDSGANWSNPGHFDQTHGMQSLYRASTGALYMGSVGEIHRSTDNGRSWQPTGAQHGGDGYGGIVGDGTHIWAMLANTGSAAFGPYRWQMLTEADLNSSPQDPHWAYFDATLYANGPDKMVFDPVHKVLYASTGGGGLLRFKLP